MHKTPMPIERPAPPQASPARDIVVVFAITALSILGSDYLNLNESLYALTRRVERFQLDELPIGMLVLLIGLIWLSWRRYAQARHEVRARRHAETRVAAVLAENRRLAQENLRIQEVERKYLARELHDELGQYLNAIKLDAVAIREGGARDAEFSTQAAVAIVSTVDHVHGAVNDMISRLRPVALDELGLAAALEHCVDHWRQRMPNTRFELTVEGSFDDLDEPLSLTVYRLIQEGLTNIHKHAGARRAGITLQRLRSIGTETDEVHVTVADDGCGMDQTARTSRFGLSGMRERVEMAGGTLQLESSPGSGMRLEAHLPAQGGG